MAALTKEQIEQKKQQLNKLVEEARSLNQELVEAGAIEIPEEEINKATGGFHTKQFFFF